MWFGVSTCYEQITEQLDTQHGTCKSYLYKYLCATHSPFCSLFVSTASPCPSEQWQALLTVPPAAPSWQPALGHGFLNVPHLLCGEHWKGSVWYQSPAHSSCPLSVPADPRADLAARRAIQLLRNGRVPRATPALTTSTGLRPVSISFAWSAHKMSSERWAFLYASAERCVFTAHFSFGGAAPKCSYQRCSPAALCCITFLLRKGVQEQPNAGCHLHQSFADGWTLALLSSAELNQTMGLFSFLCNLIIHLLL